MSSEILLGGCLMVSTTMNQQLTVPVSNSEENFVLSKLYVHVLDDHYPRSRFEV